MAKDKKIIGIIIILIVVFIAIFAINLNKTNEGTVEQPNIQTEEPNQNNMLNVTEEELIEMVNTKVKAEYKEYDDLNISFDVITNNENWFTLRMSMYEVENSSEASYKFYHIDKAKGELVNISDLFANQEYKSVISQEIKKQMKQKMKENKNLEFWLAEEGTDSFGFREIVENQNFYIADNGNIVIVFNKYEVAPGYMGTQEFEIEKEMYKDYLIK